MTDQIDQQQELSLNDRVAAAMAEITKIDFDSQNSYDKYKFASADAVYAHVRPILAKHLITLRHEVAGLDSIEVTGKGGQAQTVRLLNVRVWFEGDVKPPPVPIPLARFAPQAIQAAITYATKYFLRGRLLLETGEPDLDAEATESNAPEATPEPEPEAPIITTDPKTGEIMIRQEVISGIEKVSRADAKALFQFWRSAIESGPPGWGAKITDDNVNNLVRLVPLAGRASLRSAMEKAGFEAGTIGTLCEDEGKADE